MAIKTVVIKRRGNATNLPDHVYAEAKRKIGSTFGPNGDLNTGLSFGEQKKFLPGIIGVDSKDVNFQKEVKKYFQNLTILVENTGTKLEIGLDQEGDPTNLMDYVRTNLRVLIPMLQRMSKLLALTVGINIIFTILR